MSDTDITTEATDTPEADAIDPISLSLNDIQNAVKVIDFAAEQGAFKGWKTIEQVLNVRQRLNSFIEVAAASQGETPEGDKTETLTETTEA